ncbi:MAG: hypothetical protein MJE66_06570 [Proteobacteria bacterium]|nr:hypothetical protein [Pseudomonadota bacterium]
MGHSKALIVVVACASLACATIKLQLRSPGERVRDFPEAVAKEYDCDKRPLPFFKIESSELYPLKLQPGDEFGHRWTYVLCPESATAVVSGSLVTRIRHRGGVIFEDEIDQDLKPGRWEIDTFIPLPETTAPGLYAHEIEFRSSLGNLESSTTFIVEGP